VVTLFLFTMFLICPASFNLDDAEWFDDLYDAKQDALDWSSDLDGEKVFVYEAQEDEDGSYDFKKLCAIFA
jgi:hypothetical protein